MFGVTWPKKRGSVGGFFLFCFFLVGKGVDASISCLRFGAGDHGRSGFILFYSLNGLILED